MGMAIIFHCSKAYGRRYSTDTRTEPMHQVLSPLALSLRIELTSPTDCKRGI